MKTAPDGAGKYACFIWRFCDLPAGRRFFSGYGLPEEYQTTTVFAGEYLYFMNKEWRLFVSG